MGLIGAAEGQNVIEAQPLVGIDPIESDDFYAGSLSGKAVLWPYRGPLTPPEIGVR